MTRAQEGPGPGTPAVRFHPTSGRFVGWLSLAVVADIIGYVVVAMRSVDGLRLGTGALCFGVVVWLTQLRPRAMATQDVLRLQNSLRDVDVPLALVDEVHVGRMLSVWVGKDRFDCVGIGSPLRRLLGLPPLSQQPELTYPEFVESRIASLAEEARRRARLGGGMTQERPRAHWFRPGVAALAATGTAFVVSLLL